MSDVSVLDKVVPFHYVYFVRARKSGLVKIGRTKNLGQRLQELTAYVGPLTLLCCIPTFDPYLETQVIKFLKSHSKNLHWTTLEEGGREWFTIEDEQLFIILKEILKGFRNWSDAAPSRIEAGKSFVRVRDGELVLRSRGTYGR
jgi:hypothetical protein